MIRSSASMTADDVCIPCRIRQSPTCNNPTWDQWSSVICTMRQWTPTTVKMAKSGSGTSRIDSNPTDDDSCHHDGPELRLQQDELEQWAWPKSRGINDAGQRIRTNSINDKRKIWAELRQPNSESRIQPKEPIWIPCRDILVVDVMTGMRMTDVSPLFVTTKAGSYMEVSFSSRNSHDVLVAFLTAALTPERIQTTCVPVMNLSSCGTSESFDVEMLTSIRMRERLKDESWGEKTRRKMIHVANRIAEVSAAFTERACAPCYDEKSPAKNDSDNGQLSPPRFHFPEGMEESPEKQPDLNRCKIPSGMSMENSEVGGGI